MSGRRSSWAVGESGTAMRGSGRLGWKGELSGGVGECFGWRCSQHYGPGYYLTLFCIRAATIVRVGPRWNSKNTVVLMHFFIPIDTVSNEQVFVKIFIKPKFSKLLSCLRRGSACSKNGGVTSALQ